MVFRGIHYFGCFLLFTASILILFSTISAPIINSISLLRVDLDQQAGGLGSSVAFGTFGYCVLSPGGDQCSARHIGYDVSSIIANLAGGADFSEAAANSADGLTRALVLNPVACALTFLSFLIACGAGLIGSLIGVIVGLVAWFVTLVVMAIAFAAFGIVKNDVNDSNNNANAYYGSGMWLLLAAFVIQFFGLIIVFFTCFSAKRQRNRERAGAAPKTDYGVAGRKRRWGRSRRSAV
jgi:uncharacterized membrane protein